MKRYGSFYKKPYYKKPYNRTSYYKSPYKKVSHKTYTQSVSRDITVLPEHAFIFSRSKHKQLNAITRYISDEEESVASITTNYISSPFLSTSDIVDEDQNINIQYTPTYVNNITTGVSKLPVILVEPLYQILNEKQNYMLTKFITANYREHTQYDIKGRFTGYSTHNSFISEIKNSTGQHISWNTMTPVIFLRVDYCLDTSTYVYRNDLDNAFHILPPKSIIKTSAENSNTAETIPVSAIKNFYSTSTKNTYPAILRHQPMISQMNHNLAGTLVSPYLWLHFVLWGNIWQNSGDENAKHENVTHFFHTEVIPIWDQAAVTLATGRVLNKIQCRTQSEPNAVIDENIFMQKVNVTSRISGVSITMNRLISLNEYADIKLESNWCLANSAVVAELHHGLDILIGKKYGDSFTLYAVLLDLMNVIPITYHKYGGYEAWRVIGLGTVDSADDLYIAALKSLFSSLPDMYSIFSKTFKITRINKNQFDLKQTGNNNVALLTPVGTTFNINFKFSLDLDPIMDAINEHIEKDPTIKVDTLLNPKNYHINKFIKKLID